MIHHQMSRTKGNISGSPLQVWILCLVWCLYASLRCGGCPTFEQISSYQKGCNFFCFLIIALSIHLLPLVTWQLSSPAHCFIHVESGLPCRGSSIGTLRGHRWDHPVLSLSFKEWSSLSSTLISSEIKPLSEVTGWVVKCHAARTTEIHHEAGSGPFWWPGWQRRSTLEAYRPDSHDQAVVWTHQTSSGLTT